jgi:hypothetical protein
MAKRAKLLSTTSRILALDSLRSAVTVKDAEAFEAALGKIISGDGMDDPDPDTMDDMGDLSELAETLGEVVARMDDLDEYTGDRAFKDKRMMDSYRKTRDKRTSDRKMRDEAEAKKKEDDEKAAADARMKDAAEGKEDPEENEEERKERNSSNDRHMVRDSSSLAATYQETLSLAEILAPGIKFPAFDHRADFKLTSDALCMLKRRALKRATNDAETKPVISSIVGDEASISALPCATIAGQFASAALAVKQYRAGAGTRDQRAISQPAPGPNLSATDAIKEMNAKAKKLWSSQTNLG